MPSLLPRGATADEIARAAGARGLGVLGGFHPEAGDGAPATCATLLLLGPGADFWPLFSTSPEFSDAGPDPLDRWSIREIGALAVSLGAQPLFPFGGPPYAPFIAWAKRSGLAWGSPVGMLVHATAGLFISYRGALALRDRIDLPPALPRPCATCAAPCLTACPVSALTSAGYDLPRCHAYLDTKAGAECLTRGCAVRRACPVGAMARTEAQSAFHMATFHKRPLR